MFSFVFSYYFFVDSCGLILDLQNLFVLLTK